MIDPTDTQQPRAEDRTEHAGKHHKDRCQRGNAANLLRNQHGNGRGYRLGCQGHHDHGLSAQQPGQQNRHQSSKGTAHQQTHHHGPEETANPAQVEVQRYSQSDSRRPQKHQQR